MNQLYGENENNILLYLIQTGIFMPFGPAGAGGAVALDVIVFQAENESIEFTKEMFEENKKGNNYKGVIVYTDTKYNIYGEPVQTKKTILPLK